MKQTCVVGSIICLMQFSICSLIPEPASFTGREWLEAGLTRLGAPSQQSMECHPPPPSSMVPGNDFMNLDLVTVLFRRTWPSNTIPYLLDTSLTSTDRLVIAKAMQVIMGISCVRFIPYQEENHPLWLNISRSCACNRYEIK